MDNGTWAEKTNYNQCTLMIEDTEPDDPETDVSVGIYYAGHTSPHVVLSVFPLHLQAHQNVNVFFSPIFLL